MTGPKSCPLPSLSYIIHPTKRQATPCTGGHCVSELTQRGRQPLTPTANLESPPSLPCMSEKTHRHSMVVWWLAPSPRIKKVPGLKLCRVYCPASEQLKYVLCRSNNLQFLSNLTCLNFVYIAKGYQIYHIVSFQGVHNVCRVCRSSGWGLVNTSSVCLGF